MLPLYRTHHRKVKYFLYTEHINVRFQVSAILIFSSEDWLLLQIENLVLLQLRDVHTMAHA